MCSAENITKTISVTKNKHEKSESNQLITKFFKEINRKNQQIANKVATMCHQIKLSFN